MGASPTGTQPKMGVSFSQPCNNRTNLPLRHLQFCEVMSVLQINWNQEHPAWNAPLNGELLCCLWSLSQFKDFLSSRTFQCTIPLHAITCNYTTTCHYNVRFGLCGKDVSRPGYRASWCQATAGKKRLHFCVSTEPWEWQPWGIQLNDSGAQAWVTTAALENSDDCIYLFKLWEIIHLIQESVLITSQPLAVKSLQLKMKQYNQGAAST